jgi:hypothetical protein
MCRYAELVVPEPDRSAAGERFLNVLLASAVTGLLAAVVFAVGWYRAATAGVRLEELSVEERQQLVEEVRETLPGVYVDAWFEPRIGYTFQPGAPVELPYDTFVADDLGYRNRGVDKPPGTFRVVFVGDSWTFGHGVEAEDSFPAAFERLARRHAAGVEVEAWTLALSGYNAVNQIAALWFFAEKLAPDAVVFCPSTNDNDSSYSVLPEGSLTRLGKLADELGDRHHVSYRHIGVDSYRYRQRWRTVFELYRDAETRLDDHGIPSMFFYVAHWPDAVVHHFAAEAGLRSPYLVNPEPLRTGGWIGPEHGHGTPAANRVYGRIVYQGLARLLGWPQLPAAGDASDVELYRRPPPGDWQTATAAILGVYTERFIDESFEPPQATDKQCAGPMSCKTGRIGRASTVLVRRRRGAERLAIELARVPGAHYLYPLDVSVSIPSPSGGTGVRTTVPAAGGVHRVSIEIPLDVPPGTALDVVFEADRATAAGEGKVASSVLVRSIRQI